MWCLVLGAEHSTTLQDRHDLVDEDLERAGQVGRHDVETVRGAYLEPCDDAIGDVFRCADDRAVTAGPGQPVQQLAQRQTRLALDEVEDDA